ncbi:MAG: hypothetical protein AAGA33_08795 [Pseudomonadota bacterium]
MQTDWALSQLVVTGDDATTFLQGQLTCDVTAIGDGELAAGAWCTPKGRVIVVFRIRKRDDGFILFTPTQLADGIEKRLTMFRFRSKVDIRLRPAGPADLGLDSDLPFKQWLATDLEHGIAWIDDALTEQFTPHMLSLDLAGAVSFDKGCYTGQEVVARTHYKGSSRRRLKRFGGAEGALPGTRVQLDDRNVGTVINVVDDMCLAVVPVDDADAGLRIDGKPLSLLPLPY